MTRLPAPPARRWMGGTGPRAEKPVRLEQEKWILPFEMVDNCDYSGDNF